MDKATEILEYAQALISDGWTRGTFARNARGKEVSQHSDEACKFCMIGALDRARGDLRLSTKVGVQAERRLKAVLGKDVWVVNDSSRTKKEHVFDAFTLAIIGAP